MKKQITKGIIVIIGLIAISVLVGCASTPKGPKGPDFGMPTEFQRLLNEFSIKNPLKIAGKEVVITFEGNAWRGRVDGDDAFAGKCIVEETEEGATITLDLSWAYVDTGQINPLTGDKIAAWLEAPDSVKSELVLDYKKGPPISLSIN